MASGPLFTTAIVNAAAMRHLGNDRQDAGPTKDRNRHAGIPRGTRDCPHVGNAVYSTASNASPAQNAGLAEGSGPLGVVPTCILILRAVGTLRCPVMHNRRARSTTKSGFPMAFSVPLFSRPFSVRASPAPTAACRVNSHLSLIFLAQWLSCGLLRTIRSRGSL